MLKKNSILILLLFLTGCGYEAIHSKKNSVNYNFSITQLTFIGERGINLKIKQKLKNYTLAKKNKNFILKISSSKERTVVSKNMSGNPISFKSVVMVNVEVLMKGNNNNNLQLIESFNYNNINNKFDLKKYEREIENNLAETITDKLIFKLSNIQ